MRKKILVIDKDENLLQGIKLNLEEIADVAAVTHVKDLSKTVSEYLIDVILLDSGILGELGIDVLREIKKAHPFIGFVIMQLYGEEPEDKENNLKELIDIFVYKPVDFKVLISRLNLLVSRMA